LLRAYEPLRSSELERLRKYKIECVYSAGKPINDKDTEDELKNIVSGILTEKGGPDISEMYSISESNPQEMDAAKKHYEIIETLKANFDLSRKGKTIDLQEIRSAATSIINLVEKNKRMIFKLIFISHYDPADFIIYHDVNCSILATMTAMNMKYSKMQQLNLILGGLLQNIGMTKIPEEVLMKKEALSIHEHETLKRHPLFGYKILQSTNSFSSDVLSIVMQHHERLDGSGYPHKISGKQISEYARIIAICDTYQAMCESREYRQAKTPPMIIKTLLSEGLGKLDPVILKIFTFGVGIFPIGSIVRLNNQEYAEVMIQNINSINKPVVKVFLGPGNKIYEPAKVVNLTMEKGIDIERVLNNEESKEIFRKMGRK
jgi:HD-GYP domain-containing protein (c-di-GMP phosphodiesterase class II)